MVTLDNSESITAEAKKTHHLAHRSLNLSTNNKKRSHSNDVNFNRVNTDKFFTEQKQQNFNIQKQNVPPYNQNPVSNKHFRIKSHQKCNLMNAHNFDMNSIHNYNSVEGDDTGGAEK